MSLYDDAAFICLPKGAAGADMKVFSLKPEESVTGSELVTNGDFSSDGPGSGGLVGDVQADWTNGWRNLNDEGDAKIIDGVLKIINGSGEDDARAYASNGTDQGDFLENNKTYKLVYTVAKNDGVTNFEYYTNGGFVDAPSSPGTHTITLFNGSVNNLFLFRNSTESSEIHLDNVSIKEVSVPARDLHFTRGSNINATRVGPDGYIEKGRQNLFTYSNTLDEWDLGGSPTLTSGYAGWDNSTDAWRLVTSSGDSIYQNVTTSGVNTFSAHVKGDGSTGVRMFMDGPGNAADCFFDLSDGSIVNESPALIDANIEDLGQDWYRVSVTFYDDDTSSGDNQNVTRCRLYTTANGTANAAGTLFIQDLQLEKGLVATPVIETQDVTVTVGVLEDEPRFDYKGGGCPGVLLDPVASNLIEHSEYIGFHTVDGTGTATDNHSISPEGVKNAFQLEDTSDTAFYKASDLVNITTAADYTMSIFVKKTTGTPTFYPGIQLDTARRYIIINTTAGTAVEATGGVTIANDNFSVEDFSDDYWRVSVTNSLTTGNKRVALWPAISTAGSAEQVNAQGATVFYGWQLERNPYATSYIPNYGRSAGENRVAEILTLERITDLVDGNQYTILFDFDATDNDLNNTIIYDFRNSDNDVAWTARWYNGDKFRVYDQISGAYPGLTRTSDTSKWVFRVNEKVVDFFYDVSGTATKEPDINPIEIPRNIDKVTMTGHQKIKQFIIWPISLTDDECKSLVS